MTSPPQFGELRRKRKSAQEPRSTASLANDEAMLNAYKEGKDLYAVIGSKSFHVPYEECLEFRPTDGKLNPDGKARRSKAKTILLGISYGMGAKTLAGRLECSIKEAEDIIQYFYDGFPGVKKLTEESQKMLKEKGYVTDMWGRRRHIPDAQLPDYTIQSDRSAAEEFNPLIGAASHENSVIASRINYYAKAIEKALKKKDVIEAAKKEHIKIVDNRGFINRAMRQCLNARIQGTASSMTKQAMINIDNDELLNKLGFKLTITVHDEVLGICPTETAEEASERLSEVMVNAAKTKCVCPFKCDPYVVSDGWYEDENIGGILNKYNKLLEKGSSKEEAIDELTKTYPFFNEESIKAVCNQTYIIGRDSLKYGLNHYKMV